MVSESRCKITLLKKEDIRLNPYFCYSRLFIRCSQIDKKKDFFEVLPLLLWSFFNQDG